MHTFRFNPLFKHWVVLGNHVPHTIRIERGHLLHSGEKGQFVAATNPRQPFIIDKPSVQGSVSMLHREEPAVGEYELMLYQGDRELRDWRVEEWDSWLSLLRARVLSLHANPLLHHLTITFHSSHLKTVEGYARVGDVIATSHPVAGAAPLIEHELIQKLREKERGYILHDGPDGFMYAPSAPLMEKEVWYVAPHQHGAFDRVDREERMHTAEALALLTRAYLHEWPTMHLAIEVHTSFGSSPSDSSWWIRVYEEEALTPATVVVRPLPEKFIRDLSYLLGPGRV